MLTGTVRNLQAWVSVEIMDRNGQHRTVEAVLDSGFDGLLKLPITTIEELELARAGYRFGELADGSIKQFMSYTATVFWDGQFRSINVIEADSEPVVGMELLQGSRVTFDVREDGLVTIETLT